VSDRPQPADSGGQQRVKLSGKQKAAIFFRSVGPSVFQHLMGEMTPAEINEIMEEIPRVEALLTQVRGQVLREFYDDYNKIMSPTERSGARVMELFREVDTERILNMISKEHPQTIAFILCSLAHGKAAEVLTALPVELHKEMVQRIAQTDAPAREVVEAFEKTMGDMMSATSTTSAGGLQPLVKLLKRVDPATTKKILRELEKDDPEFATTLKSMMFLFDDIGHLDPISLQRILQDVDTYELAVALSKAPRAVRANVEKNMSGRRREMLKTDTDNLGSVTNEQVEAAQKNILDVIFRLEEENQISLSL